MRFYRLVALVGGMVILAVEITAFRIVAPFFGNSIFVTTNILGVVLAALALGYWLGGRVADKYPKDRYLYYLMILSGLLIGLIPLVAPALFAQLRNLISGLDGTLVVLSLAGSLVIFFVPFVFLGALSPWLIRLSNRNLKTTGRAAGGIYAWSTLGSLLGTFVPTWLSVPYIGSRRTFLLFAGILALVGAIGLVKKRWWLPGLTLLLAAGLISPNYFAHKPGVLAETESPVEYLRVEKNNRGQVVLRQDEGIGEHSVYERDNYLYDQYYDWVMLTPFLLPDSKINAGTKETLRVGFLGLAGGTLARGFEHFFGGADRDGSVAKSPSLEMRGVELDAATLSLARRYFGLTHSEVPHLSAFVNDARIWLNKQNTKFDILVLDAFRQLYVPPHLSSREFFGEIKQKLSKQGVLVVNLNATSPDSLVYKKVLATLQSQFADVRVLWVPRSFNVLFYAAESELPVSAMNNRVIDPALATLAKRFGDLVERPALLTDPGLVATDDRPLVESSFDRMIMRYFFTVDGVGNYL